MKIPKDLNNIAHSQESQGAQVFFKALKMQYTDLAAKFERGNTISANKDIIKIALTAFHSKVQLNMAEWQFNRLNKEISVKALQIGVHERILSKIKAWILINTGESVTSISNTTLDVVKRIIDKGQTDGLGSKAIGKLIRDEADSKFTAYRSTVIARTEGTRASSQGTKFGAQQWETITGQKKWKAWSASADDRTRDQHLAMIDSKPIPGDQDFIVGGKPMDGPGDPKGGIHNCVNCRCRQYFMSERVAKSIINGN